MTRFTFKYFLLLLLSLSFYLCAVLPRAVGIATSATNQDTPPPNASLLSEVHLLPHYRTYTVPQTVYSSHLSVAKRNEPKEAFSQPDSITDLLNDDFVDEVVRQIIWKGEIGGDRNLYRPERSLLPATLILLNDTAGILKDLIPLVDAIGTISVESRWMWRELRSGYESWSAAMLARIQNKVASLDGVPEELEPQLGGELGRSLLKEAIQIGALQPVDTNNTKRLLEATEKSLREWQRAIDNIAPESEQPFYHQHQLLDEATRLELAYNQTEQLVQDEMKRQNDTLHALLGFIRAEMAHFESLLEERVLALDRQRDWYARQLSAPPNILLDSNATEPGYLIQRMFDNVDKWTPEAKQRIPTAVGKVEPHLQAVKLRLRDHQIQEDNQMASWRVSMRKPLEKVRVAREKLGGGSRIRI